MAHTCAGSPTAGLVSRWVPFWTRATNNDPLMYVRAGKKKTAARGARPPPLCLPAHGGAPLLPQRAHGAARSRRKEAPHSGSRRPAVPTPVPSPPHPVPGSAAGPTRVRRPRTRCGARLGPPPSRAPIGSSTAPSARPSAPLHGLRVA